MIETQPMPEDTVGRLYGELRRMAADFEFRPSERLNESRLALRLGASRTPLREALNRLVAEGFLDFRSGQGFFCRALSPEGIFHLYEARAAIECAALGAAIDRAEDAAIAGLAAYLDRTEGAYDRSTDPVELLEMDEGFHVRLCALAGNPEFDSMLSNVNGRIRYVRSIDLKQMRASGAVTERMSAHRRVLQLLIARDKTAAMDAMRAHIEKRRDQATEAVRLAFADIYAPREGAE
ncbi:GntR family transcriptional regulator [Defluviimonas sp. SAOS-178_SWC]|uniref:GntR family transcriptional regulator n=1 Tax=Defluviimonas sp. SAOS-178_SWC TaxID=3121287 RepID=UPI00322154F4